MLDRDVVAVDQIRTVIRTFSDRLFTEIFPGRTEVPKTLIFAKDDSHAEDIVQIVREEFGKGNDFAQKITYRTTGAKPEDLLASFRNSYNPRIAVTVDMIATGTDIKPLEVVMFLRTVKSRNFFEQMKGRGVRVITGRPISRPSPRTTRTKDHFVLVDCVGVCESEPLRQLFPGAPAERLIQAAPRCRGLRAAPSPDIVSSLAGRLARLDRRIGWPDRLELEQLAGGRPFADLVGGLVDALDPDRQAEEARRAANLPAEVDPTEPELKAAEEKLIQAAVAPLASNPELRNRLLDLKDRYERTYDHVSIDEVREAGFSANAREKAEGLVRSFEQFVEDNRDEITALQILYSRPYQGRLRLKDIKDLANLIQSPPRSWTPERLWSAYEVLAHDRVRGAGGGKLLTDIVSLVRFALHSDKELVPFKDSVEQRFQSWLAQQANAGRRFTPEQIQWFELMRDHIVGSLQIEMDDFDYAPFSQRGGRGRAYEVFGEELGGILEELNEVLAA